MSEFKLTQRNYFSKKRPHLSNSQINDYLFNPEYFYKRHVSKSLSFHTTDPMKLGSMVDERLTKGRCTYKVGVRKKDQKNDKLVTQAMWDKGKDMASYVRKHDFWKELMNTKGVQMQKILEGVINSTKICGMADIIVPGRLIDLKCTNATNVKSEKKWHYHCLEMGYYRQLALYNKLLGGGNKCYHLCLSETKTDFYELRLFRADMMEIDNALVDVLKAIDDIKKKKFDSPRLMF